MSTQNGSSDDVEMAPLVGNESETSNEEIVKDSSPDVSNEKSAAPAKIGAGLMSCLVYSFCSVTMVMVNKSLASSYNSLIDGDVNLLLVVFQAITAVVCVELSKKMKWVEYPNFNMATARQWAPVNIFFCLMLFTGMGSLQHNNVPMVTVFKNVANIFITFGDYLFYGTPADILVKSAFGIMLLGAVMAARNDISLTPIGLIWMMGNCISTSGYVLYMKYATKSVKLSKFGMVFYNNVLCTLFLLPAAAVRGEISLVTNTPEIHTLDYLLKNILAGFVGFFLNFASLNCVSISGPTTYALVGSLNKIPVAILGYFLFQSVIDEKTWFFIGVSMSGGFLYSYAQVRKNRLKAQELKTSSGK